MVHKLYSFLYNFLTIFNVTRCLLLSPQGVGGRGAVFSNMVSCATIEAKLANLPLLKDTIQGRVAWSVIVGLCHSRLFTVLFVRMAASTQAATASSSASCSGLSQSSSEVEIALSMVPLLNQAGAGRTSLSSVSARRMAFVRSSVQPWLAFTRSSVRPWSAASP